MYFTTPVTVVRSAADADDFEPSRSARSAESDGCVESDGTDTAVEWTDRYVLFAGRRLSPPSDGDGRSDDAHRERATSTPPFATR